MKIHHRTIDPPTRRRACININGIYYGWTGFEYFGVVWPFRYFGWRVTCWAQVMAWVYDDGGRANIFFDRLEPAVDALEVFMDVAQTEGQLARRPVKYFDGFPEPSIESLCRFEWINPHMKTNPRAPDSPAFWRHFGQRHGRAMRDRDPEEANRLLGGTLLQRFGPRADARVRWGY